MHEVVCAGILVADHACTPMERLPGEGDLVAVDAMHLHTGGCAANVAVNVAKQGISVGVAGRVGDDYWGRFIQEDLASRGVDTTQVRISASQQTSQTMVLLCRGQDRRFVHTFGANRDFTAADVRLDTLDGARVFYVGGYLILPGLAPEELAALFKYCRRRGIRTVLDVVAPSGFRYSGELDPVLPHTDVFLPNIDEAGTLTGEREPALQAAELLRRGAETVVITMGEDGLVFAREGGLWQARPFPSTVVDQTGTGDAFCAGFIAGMVRGMDLPACIRYGSALGSSCVRAFGFEGVFTAEQANRFLADNRLDIAPVRTALVV